MALRRNMSIGLAAVMALGLGACAVDAASAGDETQVNQTSIEVPFNVAFDGEVRIHAPSPHPPHYTIRVGELDHPYVKGFALLVDEKGGDGACQAYKVFEFASKDLIVVRPFGNPSCSSVEAKVERITSSDAAYQTELDALVSFLERAERGYYVEGASEPKLHPVLAYLKGVALEHRVSFEGEIKVLDGPSAHSRRYYAQVGRVAYSHGQGFVLLYREMVPDGACWTNRAFDFETKELTLVPSFGNPSCGSIAGNPQRLLPGDGAYKTELQVTINGVKAIADGKHFPNQPEPKLVPALKALEQYVATP